MECRIEIVRNEKIICRTAYLDLLRKDSNNRAISGHFDAKNKYSFYALMQIRISSGQNIIVEAY